MRDRVITPVGGPFVTPAGEDGWAEISEEDFAALSWVPITEADARLLVDAAWRVKAWSGTVSLAWSVEDAADPLEDDAGTVRTQGSIFLALGGETAEGRERNLLRWPGHGGDLGNEVFPREWRYRRVTGGAIIAAPASGSSGVVSGAVSPGRTDGRFDGSISRVDLVTHVMPQWPFRLGRREGACYVHCAWEASATTFGDAPDTPIAEDLEVVPPPVAVVGFNLPVVRFSATREFPADSGTGTAGVEYRPIYDLAPGEAPPGTLVDEDWIVESTARKVAAYSHVGTLVFAWGGLLRLEFPLHASVTLAGEGSYSTSGLPPESTISQFPVDIEVKRAGVLRGVSLAGSLSGAIEFAPAEFWPYCDEAGAAIYDVETGERVE